MFWVVQKNLFNERQFDEFIAVLDRSGVPYEIVDVVPISHELTPAIDPPQPCIVYGSTALTKIAQKRGWYPGSFFNDNFDSRVWLPAYGSDALNDGAQVYPFNEVPEQPPPFFIRPTGDTKTFNGEVYESWEKFAEWRHRVVALKETYTTLDAATPVLVGPAYAIIDEHRHWFVDGRRVTSSRYRRRFRLSLDPQVDEDIGGFAEAMAAKFSPDRAFVLDTALLPDRVMKVIEINNINSAGLYACDVSRLVQALDALEP